MELAIIRNYHPQGTNGTLLVNGEMLCYTIELPWLNNRPQYSCIPEGKYTVSRRWNAKWGLHLIVNQVPGRSYILLHPANDALKELKGCVAPVTRLTGPGKGSASRSAFGKLVKKISALPPGEPIIVNIKSIPLNEPIQQLTNKILNN